MIMIIIIIIVVIIKNVLIEVTISQKNCFRGIVLMSFGTCWQVWRASHPDGWPKQFFIQCTVEGGYQSRVCDLGPVRRRQGVPCSRENTRTPSVDRRAGRATISGDVDDAQRRRSPASTPADSRSVSVRYRGAPGFRPPSYFMRGGTTDDAT